MMGHERSSLPTQAILVGASVLGAGLVSAADAGITNLGFVRGTIHGEVLRA